MAAPVTDPAVAPLIEHAALGDVTLGYVSRGQGPLVICLHGFPDTLDGFLPVLDALAAAGFRAVAPGMRGYLPSSRAISGRYRVEELAQDVVGLADALGADTFSIIGHDWGAVTAYAAANLAPQRVRRLVTAAVPHTAHFLRSPTLQQLRRSHYIFRFQLPGWAERRIPRDDFAWLRGLIRSWSPDWPYREADLARLLATMSDPARLKATIQYYRELSRGLASAQTRRLVFGTVAAPTRIIYGGRDGCIGSEMFPGQSAHFATPPDLCLIPDAGHFMQWEQPQRFAELAVEFLSR